MTVKLITDQHSGLVYMLWAQVMFAIMAGCVRALKAMAFMEIVFLRSIAGLVILGGFMYWRGHPFLGTRHLDLVLRGSCGYLSLVAYYYAITHLPLATATLLANTAPLIVALLARFFLQTLGGENTRVLDCIASESAATGTHSLTSIEFTLGTDDYSIWVGGSNLQSGLQQFRITKRLVCCTYR